MGPLSASPGSQGPRQLQGGVARPGGQGPGTELICTPLRLGKGLAWGQRNRYLICGSPSGSDGYWNMVMGVVLWKRLIFPAVEGSAGGPRLSAAAGHFQSRSCLTARRRPSGSSSNFLAQSLRGEHDPSSRAQVGRLNQWFVPGHTLRRWSQK